MFWWSSLLVALAFGGSCSNCVAQNASEPTWVSPDGALGLITWVDLQARDDVEGDCWTNSEAIRSKVHLIFEQNDMYVAPDDIFRHRIESPKVELSAFGHRDSAGTCVVSASFDVEFWAHDNQWRDAKESPIVVAFKGSLFRRDYVVWNKGRVNEALDEFFVSSASELAAKVISARRNDAMQGRGVHNMFSDFRPLSTKEFEERESD